MIICHNHSCLFNHLRGVLDSRSPHTVGIDLRPAAQLRSTERENIRPINNAAADKLSTSLDAAGDKMILSTATPRQADILFTEAKRHLVHCRLPSRAVLLFLIKFWRLPNYWIFQRKFLR